MMTNDSLAELHARCFTSPRPWSAAEFRDLLRSDRVFLREEPGGFLVGRIAGPEAELLTLAVAPSARRQGVGTRLVAAFAAHARQCGARQAFLEVAQANIAAIALYQRAGYHEVGHRKDYYDGPKGLRISALVFTRSLTAD